jgi:[DsrC]-trisulfide reductase subunit O
MTQNPEVTRRQLLAGAGMSGAIAVAPGVTLYAIAGQANATVSDTTRWGMLVDTNKCKKGCDDCVTACNTENGLDGPSKSEATRAQWIRKLDLTDKNTGAERSLPMMCQHCASPPCVDVCPTGASFKRADGIVLVDKHICIGCRYCMMACPYKARSFVHETLEDQKTHAPRGKGTVESCTLCVHRIDAGGTPACVEACTEADHNAMIFGDMMDPDSEISKRLKAYPSVAVRGDLGLDPGVRYSGL